jgi:hypothetical protein
MLEAAVSFTVQHEVEQVHAFFKLDFESLRKSKVLQRLLEIRQTVFSDGNLKLVLW